MIHNSQHHQNMCSLSVNLLKSLSWKASSTPTMVWCSRVKIHKSIGD